MSGAADRLKLKAEDGEDFQIFSAILQDALVPLADMIYLPQEQRFVMVVNRFRWEGETAGDAAANGAPPVPDAGDAAFLESDGAPRHERVLTGLSFDGVHAVRLRGIEQRQRGRILALLSISRTDGAVVIELSGGGAIRLEGAAILARLEDRGEPWPTVWRPDHAVTRETPER